MSVGLCETEIQKKNKREKWGILHWGSQPLHRQDTVMESVVCVEFCMLVANLCGCLHSVCMINHAHM